MSRLSALGASSLWYNAERLLAGSLSPRWARLLLGVTGGASVYPPHPLAEFELCSARSDRLSSRSGVQVELRGDEPGQAALRAWLATGKAAIVAVDSFHLSYRPAFGRVHSGRTIIVRGGSVAGSVSVEDWWPPAWKGEIALRELDAARASDVPLDPFREPIFAGVPLGRRWWTLSAPAAPPPDARGWLRARLADLAGDEKDIPGPFAHLLRSLCGGLSDEPAACRRLALILRAELSARAYGLALLTEAAAALDDTLLVCGVREYWRTLQQLAQGRDLLIKQCVRPHPLYAQLIEENLSAGAEGAAALAGLLRAYAASDAREVRYA